MVHAEMIRRSDAKVSVGWRLFDRNIDGESIYSSETPFIELVIVSKIV